MHGHWEGLLTILPAGTKTSRQDFVMKRISDSSRCSRSVPLQVKLPDLFVVGSKHEVILRLDRHQFCDKLIGKPKPSLSVDAS